MAVRVPSMIFRHLKKTRYALNHLLILKYEPERLSRLICTTKVVALKQIIHTEQDNVTYVEGVSVESGGNKSLIDQANNDKDIKCCPICRLNLKLQHTDVLVLNQFIDSRGNVIPKHVTGLCKLQHSKVINYVEQAQKAGLLKKPSIVPPRVEPQKFILSEKRFKQYFIDNYFPPYN